MDLADALLAGIDRQCDVESVSESAYSIIGPLDVDELATYIETLLIEGEISLV